MYFAFLQFKVLSTFNQYIFLGSETKKHWTPKQGIQPIFTEETRDSDSTLYPEAGSELTLNCAALGQPEPTIIWKKDSVRIQTNGIFQESSLRLTKLSRTESGIYSCIAQNKHGQISKNFSIHVNDPVIINEIEPPRPEMPSYSSIQHLLIPNDPENTTVAENGKAILDCKARVRRLFIL